MDKSIINILSDDKKQGLNFDIKHIQKGIISIFIVNKKYALIAEIHDDLNDDSFKVVSRVVILIVHLQFHFTPLFLIVFKNKQNYERTHDEIDKTLPVMTQMKHYVMDLTDEMFRISKNNKYLRLFN